MSPIDAFLLGLGLGLLVGLYAAYDCVLRDRKRRGVDP